MLAQGWGDSSDRIMRISAWARFTHRTGQALCRTGKRARCRCVPQQRYERAPHAGNQKAYEHSGAAVLTGKDAPGSASHDVQVLAATGSQAHIRMENWKADVLLVDDEPKNLLALEA